jgi:ribosomal-protein-alanine N-acetyltransferase
MANPDSKPPGKLVEETGATVDTFHVAPVSHLWLGRLVEIDSNWNPRSWSVQLFERELSSSSSRVRGLFVQDLLVGYLIAHVVCDEAHIVSFGIAPEWREKGGGKFLLADFLRMAPLEGVVVISLDVRASNQRARNLYSRYGFSVAGVRRRYYSDNGEDALTMRVELPRSNGKRSEAE